MPYVGGTEVATLDVPDGDATTEATLLVTAPDGTTADGGAVPTDGTHTRWTATVSYPLPEGWVLSWTVTGAGANVTHQPVFVTPAPIPGGPIWRPSLAKVASYIPGRTLVAVKVEGVATGADAPERTFDNSTEPPGTVVDQLVTDAVAWVLLATGPITDKDTPAAQTIRDAAGATAAVWAASAVERGYPDRDEDVKTAADLLALATSMRRDLAFANEAATGTDPTDPAASLLPLYSFPPPSRWGDCEFN